MSQPEAKQNLFEEDSDDDDDDFSVEQQQQQQHVSPGSNHHEMNDNMIRINQKYATEYQSRKQRQELASVRRHGDVDEDMDDGIIIRGSSSSSSDESEDEDGDLMTPAMDVTILKTINALRNKDERIYNPSTRFFPEDDEDNNDEDNDDIIRKEKQHKPKRYKDVLREQILQQIKDEEEASSSEQHNDKRHATKEHMSKLEYDEEQKALRSAFLDSITREQQQQDDDDEDDDDENDDWMVLKTKQNDNNDTQDEKVTQFLMQKEIAVLEKTTSSESKLEDPHGEVKDGEQFLLDFIKNKKWIDRTEQTREEEEQHNGNDDSENDNDSIEQLDKTDEFESKYNFRFEEAAQQAAAGTSGADHSVIAYGRDTGTLNNNTLRRKDERRRLKRLEQKERKAAERKAKEEQLRRLKNAKRQEMESKLEQIKRVVLGQHQLFEEGAASAKEEKKMDEAAMMKLMEGDYDPEKFEQIMKEAYGDDFYERQDAEWKTDNDVRESLKQDEDGGLLVGQDDVDGGLYDNYEDEVEQEQDMEDSGEWADDAELDNGGAFAAAHGEDAETETEKKLKAKMMDELYKLDYEDIVAGMPTRFKYRNVEPNNYGLSTEEILFARDTTLKQFVSLKKMAPYREEGEYFVTGKKRRRFRELMQQDTEEELRANEKYETGEVGSVEDTAEKEVDKPKKKRRRQKKGKKKNRTPDEAGADLNESVVVPQPGQSNKANEGNAVDPAVAGKRRRKKKGNKKQREDPEEESPTNTHLDSHVLTEDSTQTKEEKQNGLLKNKDKNQSNEKRKKKKRRKKSSVSGVSASRLAAYGL